MQPLPTLRQLSYLVSLATHQHFGHAAEAAFVTQSTLSAGLQELEAVLGVTLVERTKRRVMLTPLGEEVARRARDLLCQAEELVAVACAATRPLTGTLRLGIIPTVGPYLLPRALPTLRQRYPELRLYLREDLTVRLLEQLAAAQLDAVLLALPWRSADIEVEELMEDPFYLVCPGSHPLGQSGSAPVVPAELQAEELLLLEDGHCLREHALAVCGLTAPSGDAFRGTSLPTLIQMVAAGLGLTLLPRLAVVAGAHAGTGLVARPLAGVGGRRIGLAWRPSSPRKEELRLLAAVLREELQAMVRPTAR